jgi:hypothetical protein
MPQADQLELQGGRTRDGRTADLALAPRNNAILKFYSRWRPVLFDVAVA